MTELISRSVAAHLDAIVPHRPPELREMEEFARARDFPIIGPASGHLCYLVARMIGARSVFELGSGFGYSTAFFARAVQDNGGGEVHHVVWDGELSARARNSLDALGYGDIVRYHVGEAVEALRRSEGPFDLVFNDIDKDAYPSSLEVIEAKLRPGGVLIVDNMLWGGRIFDAADRTPATEGVRELTRLVTTRAGWSSTVVPIRDGLLLAMREES